MRTLNIAVVGSGPAGMYLVEALLMDLFAAAATLLIAYIKARLVVLDFMELRQAAFVWRAMTEAWLLIISLTFLVFVLH